MATKWAQSRAAPRCARRIVARTELIDPQKIGVLMVQNRGATSEVFTNEADALKWLAGRQPAAHAGPTAPVRRLIRPPSRVTDWPRSVDTRR